ncbi:hypothetical protein N9230_03790 [Akkermansiaceae bacterium]|nr:hypothetical protein [Akkermansiaceae bacterium]
MKPRVPVIVAAAVCSQLLTQVYAQSTLLDWGQSWNYMHPNAGVLPAGSGTTNPHPDDTTAWFAPATEFDASYSGPSFTTGGCEF